MLVGITCNVYFRSRCRATGWRGEGGRMDALIGPDEGPVVEMREGDGPFVVACEHASNRLPRALGGLGLSQSDLERHIAWDPGAAEVADGLAARLGGDLLKQRFSRLAIDCNRSPELPDAIATLSEDTTIPGNLGLTAEAREDRVAAFWTPFHAALEKLIERRLQRAAADGSGDRSQLHAGLSRGRPAVARRDHLDRRAQPGGCHSCRAPPRSHPGGRRQPTLLGQGQRRLHDPSARPRPRPAARHDRNPQRSPSHGEGRRRVDRNC